MSLRRPAKCAAALLLVASISVSNLGCGDDKGGASSASANAPTKSSGAAPSASPGASTTASAKPADVVQSGAEPYASKDGGYTVQFPPGTPKISDKPDPDGYVWHEAEVQTPTGEFFVQYSDFTNSGEALGIVKTFQPTRDTTAISNDHEFDLEGRKARELDVAVGPRLTLSMRFVIDGARVYKIGGASKTDKAVLQGFIESLKITRAGAPGASASGTASSNPAAPPGPGTPKGPPPGPKPPPPVSKAPPESGYQ